MMIHVEINETELTKLVMRDLSDRLGDIPLKLSDVRIEVKSKQNYKSEWEAARFRASVNINTDLP